MANTQSTATEGRTKRTGKGIVNRARKGIKAAAGTVKRGAKSIQGGEEYRMLKSLWREVKRLETERAGGTWAPPARSVFARVDKYLQVH
jgi:hypothetical protein